MSEAQRNIPIYWREEVQPVGLGSIDPENWTITITLSPEAGKRLSEEEAGAGLSVTSCFEITPSGSPTGTRWFRVRPAAPAPPDEPSGAAPGGRRRP